MCFLYQSIMELVEGNFTAAGDEIQNATRLLELAQAALDAANKALGVSNNSIAQFAAVVHVTFTLLLYQLVHTNRGSHH